MLEGPERFNAGCTASASALPTGADLPGEETGVTLPLDHYSGSSMGNLPIGQGELVTPMQMATAYAAIANGGILRPPHIVAAIGGRPQPVPAGTGSSPARQPRRAAQHAPGRARAGRHRERRFPIPGYQLAGKTGHGQQDRSRPPANTRNAPTSPRSSASPRPPDPKLLCAVVVDEPQTGLDLRRLGRRSGLRPDHELCAALSGHRAG